MSERVYVPGQDDELLLALRADVWGADHPHTCAAFYKWLFQDTPGRAGSGFVYLREGEAIGFAGIAARQARMGDARLSIAHGLDFMVSPNLTGVLSGRVGVKVLNRHARLGGELGNDLTLNYPNDNSHRMLISKQVRYAPVFSPTLFVRTLGPVSFPDAGLAKALGGSAAGIAAALYGTVRSAGAARGIDVAEIEEFDARFDAHWERLCQDGMLRFQRDAETLNWRYDYTIFAAQAADGILGYVVVSEREVSGTQALLICDLAVAGDDGAVGAALLAKVAAHARAQGLALIATQALPGTSLQTMLAKAGYLAVPDRLNPKPFRMIAMAYTEAGKPALDPANWAFTWGDMDVV